jgi:SAM-dependent methyltransferase
MVLTPPIPDTVDRIRVLLNALGPERVWRPVLGPDGDLLAPGDGSDPAALAAILDPVDVVGKSVADLGCNLGFFSFLVRRRGASHVVGLDIFPEIIDAANLLATLYGLTDVHFVATDFLRNRPETPCDMALLIDFIGRRIIARGRLAMVAAAATSWGTRELFFTMRPSYTLDDLPLPPEDLERFYPGFVREGRFFLIDCFAALLGPGWNMRYVNGANGSSRGRGKKVPVLFSKAGG